MLIMIFIAFIVIVYDKSGFMLPEDCEDIIYVTGNEPKESVDLNGISGEDDESVREDKGPTLNMEKAETDDLDDIATQVLDEVYNG